MENNIIERIRHIINNYGADKDVLVELKRLIYETEKNETNIRDSEKLTALYEEQLKTINENNGNQNVIPTGFRDLDTAIGGFTPGELVIIGGRPSMGKTQLLVNLALNISERWPVQYFTYDLSSALLTSRFMATLTGIPSRRIMQLELNEEEKSQLDGLKRKFAGKRIFINDSCSNSVMALKEHCQKQMEEQGVKLIFLDYLQMMSSNRYRNNRELEISYIVRELKNFAKDNDVCVIATSQLSRAPELRPGNKRPQLSDLRDSGSIEQDADKVIFVYRPEYYCITEDDEGNSTDCMVELIVAKNRNGALKNIWIQRDKDFTGYFDFVEAKNDFAFSQTRLNELDKPLF